MRELELFRPGDQVLEVGCATGELLHALGDTGIRSVGVDINAFAVRKVRSAAPVTADALRLPFPDATFDALISTHVIEHVASVGGFLEELMRVLRPDGKLFLAYPAEPVRGLFASWSSFRLYGSPFAGRRIHLHRVSPGMITSFLDPRVTTHYSTLCLAPLPQFFTVIRKLPALERSEAAKKEITTPRLRLVSKRLTG
jgi:SAM-dependent methyltransferase